MVSMVLGSAPVGPCVGVPGMSGVPGSTCLVCARLTLPGVPSTSLALRVEGVAVTCGGNPSLGNGAWPSTPAGLLAHTTRGG